MTENATEQNTIEQKALQCTLPHTGEKGESIVKEVNKQFKAQKTQFKITFVFKMKRLSSHFNLKDRQERTHLLCSMKSTAIKKDGETGRRVEGRFKKHENHILHVAKHTLESGYSYI